MGEHRTLAGLDVYCATPPGQVLGEQSRGTVLLIHEIWGLVPHIIRVADRFADAGFDVFAPDLLREEGLDPERGQELFRLRNSPDEAERTAAQPALREAFSMAGDPEFITGVVVRLRRLLDAMEAEGHDRVAVVGFCFGGSVAFQLAAADHRLRGAVPFYGVATDAEDSVSIRCPVLAFYGDQDTRLVDVLPDVEQWMLEGGVDFSFHVYAGAGHAFFNDENASTFVPEAAQDAWERTLAFLDRVLAV